MNFKPFGPRAHYFSELKKNFQRSFTCMNRSHQGLSWAERCQSPVIPKTFSIWKKKVLKVRYKICEWGHFWNDGVRTSKNLYHKRTPAKTENPLFQNSGNWSLATIKGLFIQEKQLDLRTASFASFWLTLISCPQIYDSLENQQPCNYIRCENQQPSSHSRGRIGFAFNRSFISRELSLSDLSSSFWLFFFFFFIWSDCANSPTPSTFAKNNQQ